MATLNKGCIRVNMLEYSLEEVYRNYLQIILGIRTAISKSKTAISKSKTAISKSRTAISNALLLLFTLTLFWP